MVLEKLLKILNSGDTCTLSELSRQLEVSEVLLAHMLADLQRMGYLQVVDSCNEQACPHCPQAGACSPASPLKLWRLREPVSS